VQKSLMPKGVDHCSGAFFHARSSSSVQKSLMPKGVDHADQSAVRSAVIECKNL